MDFKRHVMDSRKRNRQKSENIINKTHAWRVEKETKKIEKKFRCYINRHIRATNGVIDVTKIDGIIDEFEAKMLQEMKDQEGLNEEFTHQMEHIFGDH